MTAMIYAGNTKECAKQTAKIMYSNHINEEKL